MENTTAIMTFEPTGWGPLTYTLLAALIFLLSGFYIWKSKTIHSRYRQMLTMLLFFGFIISAGISIFNYMEGEKIGPVIIHQDHVQTAYGILPYDQVRDVLIFLEKKGTELMPQVNAPSNKRLLIITEDENTYAFSASNYPVEAMIGPMREALENYKKQKGTRTN